MDFVTRVLTIDRLYYLWFNTRTAGTRMRSGNGILYKALLKG